MKLLFQESQGEAKQAGLGLRSPLAPTWACDQRSQPRAAPPSARLPWEKSDPTPQGAVCRGWHAPQVDSGGRCVLSLKDSGPTSRDRVCHPVGKGNDQEHANEHRAPLLGQPSGASFLSQATPTPQQQPLLNAWGRV